LLSESPFFIVGSGRSGSTLLRLLLSSHSRIHIPPETWFIIPLVRRFPLHHRLLPDQLTAAVEIITTHYRWPDLGLAATDMKRWAAELSEPLLSDVIDLVYDNLLRSSGKQRIGDKTPPYIGIVPQLVAMYPGARFIHLIRDGRDVAASFIELQYKIKYYHGERFEWTAAIRRGLSCRDSGYSGQVLDIRYENLVRDPKATLAEICCFLGETFEPEMLAGRIALGAVPERERGIHRKLALPITKDEAGAWRHKLSALECFLMEACLRRDLIALNYPLRFQAVSWQPLLGATRFALEKSAPLLDTVIPALKRRDLFPKQFYL
jgi:hypothetical protein